MEVYKKTSMVVMLLSVMFLLFGMTGVANAFVILGPDMTAEHPASPYTFTHTAGGYGYELEISANSQFPEWDVDLPEFTLTNTSINGWADIASFKFTIGDTEYNFDHLGGNGPVPIGYFTTDLGDAGSFSNSIPDNVNNDIRSDYILYSGFTGFNPGDVFTFMADVDLDGELHPGSSEDFQTIFWNNGEVLNSEITVTFVPEPATLSLLGLGSLVLLRKRRA
jgi:hypothetical protein